MRGRIEGDVLTNQRTPGWLAVTSSWARAVEVSLRFLRRSQPQLGNWILKS